MFKKRCFNMKKFTALLMVTAFAMAGCGGSSIPQKGYDKWVETVRSELGIKEDDTIWQPKNAYYVWIKGDGNLPAESLKDSVWYKAYYSLKGYSFCTYVMYDGVYAKELDNDRAYYTAYELVKNGTLDGEIGEIKP